MRILIADIQRVVAEHYGIGVRNLRERDARPEISDARQVAMFLSRTLPTLNRDGQQTPRFSYGRIGDFFGGRNQKTIWHGVRRTQRRLTKDKHLTKDIAAIERELGGGQ